MYLNADTAYVTLQTTSPVASLRGSEVSLVAYRGITFRLSLGFTDVNNAPIDLTGYTGVFSALNELFVLTSADGGISNSGITGILTVNKSAQDMLTIPTCEGRYSLSITGPSGGDTVIVIRGLLHVVSL